MISNDIDMVLGSLEVVTPDFEAFKDGEQLLVMGVIVALGVGEGTGVESNGIDFAIGSHGGNNSCEGIIGSVGFDEHGVVRSPMG